MQMIMEASTVTDILPVCDVVCDICGSVAIGSVTEKDGTIKRLCSSHIRPILRASYRFDEDVVERILGIEISPVKKG